MSTCQTCKQAPYPTCSPPLLCTKPQVATYAWVPDMLCMVGARLSMHHTAHAWSRASDPHPGLVNSTEVPESSCCSCCCLYNCRPPSCAAAAATAASALSQSRATATATSALSQSYAAAAATAAAALSCSQTATSAAGSVPCCSRNSIPASSVPGAPTERPTSNSRVPHMAVHAFDGAGYGVRPG